MIFWYLPSGNLLQFAIENGPVKIVDCPIKNGGSFHSLLYVYQRGSSKHMKKTWDLMSQKETTTRWSSSSLSWIRTHSRELLGAWLVSRASVDGWNMVLYAIHHIIYHIIYKPSNIKCDIYIYIYNYVKPTNITGGHHLVEKRMAIYSTLDEISWNPQIGSDGIWWNIYLSIYIYIYLELVVSIPLKKY